MTAFHRTLISTNEPRCRAYGISQLITSAHLCPAHRRRSQTAIPTFAMGRLRQPGLSFVLPSSFVLVRQSRDLGTTVPTSVRSDNVVASCSSAESINLAVPRSSPKLGRNLDYGIGSKTPFTGLEASRRRDSSYRATRKIVHRPFVRHAGK